MSSNYTGNAFGTQAPSPKPAPGSDPIIVIPADTDPNNVATMFNQQYKMTADNLAYLNHYPDGYFSFKTIWVDGTGGLVNGSPTSLVPSSLMYVNGNSTVQGVLTSYGGMSLIGSNFITQGGNISVDGYIVASGTNGAIGGNSGIFDGLGGTAGVAVPGAVTVATVIAGSSEPTSSSFHKNVLYWGSLPVMWAIYTGTGAFLIQGSNIQSTAYNGVGSYTFTLKTAATAGASNNYCCIATASSATLIAGAVASTSAGVTTCTVTVKNTAGTNTDANTVSVVMFGV